MTGLLNVRVQYILTVDIVWPKKISDNLMSFPKSDSSALAKTRHIQPEYVPSQSYVASRGPTRLHWISRPASLSTSVCGRAWSPLRPKVSFASNSQAQRNAELTAGQFPVRIITGRHILYQTSDCNRNETLSIKAMQETESYSSSVTPFWGPFTTYTRQYLLPTMCDLSF